MTGTPSLPGIADAGGVIFGNTALTARGDQDIYVAKYDARGQLLWAHQEGSSTYDGASDIAVDEGGNAYLAGYFYKGQATFGNVALNGSAVFGNLALIKYDSQGRVSWVMTQQGGGNMFATDLAVNKNGDVYITGEFQNSIQLGTQSATVSSGPPSPLQEGFIAKLKSNLPLLIPSVSLFIPNIITPNGDGQNDQFKIIGLEPGQWSCTVYNLWGRKVFEAPRYQQDWQADGLIRWYLLLSSRKRQWAGEKGLGRSKALTNSFLNSRRRAPITSTSTPPFPMSACARSGCASRCPLTVADCS